MVNLKNKNGIVILIICYLIVIVLLILGVAFFYRSFSESKIAERQKNSIQAISIAEGGVERAIYELRQDFVGDLTSPSWADGDINGIACGPDTQNFYILVQDIVLGNGAYTVELKNVEGQTDQIWIRSTGTVGDINKIIQTYVKIQNFSPWNNVIFGGAGSSGTLINGNVDIRGSVHILGEGLSDSDFAIDMSGSGNIGNNYSGIPSDLEDRIPDCPTTLYNGETVDSLGAEVRIRNGLAGLSGIAEIGNPDIFGNSFQETVNGVFITDGYGGNQGAENVYSDNGTENDYDLGDSVRFPSLSDSYQGYPTYQEYLMDNALVISGLNINPNSTFSYSNLNGSISMDGNGNLTVSGIVYIDDGNLNMNKSGPDDDIYYSGSGAILVEGNVGINVNLVTSGNNSFPTNIIGIMTPNQIRFNAANINVTGIFYAEDEIISQKQVSVAGTFVSNYFDMTQQVPSIYQVPDVINHLPDGMIGSEPIWVMRVVSWQEQ